jgi:hypothetical protein
MRLATTLTPLLLLVAVAGCDQSPTTPTASASRSLAAPAAMKVAEAPNGPQLAYHHWLDFEMPASSVAPRYERARDKCLADAAAHGAADSTPGCVLLNASIDAGDVRNGRAPHASLTVRLPHAAVDAYAQALLQPVAGEAAGAAELRARNTTADDLTAAIQDTNRRLAQLTDYRDRLTELAKRSDAKVEDLIKVQQELSNTQNEIEAITAQQKHFTEQVATELLTINLSADAAAGSVSGPIGQVWRNAGAVLGQNAAAALRFAIGAVPWLAVGAVALALLALVRLLFRRRRGWNSP